MSHLTKSILAVCLAASATTPNAADDPAKELGIKPGTSYAKARSKLLAEGWKLETVGSSRGSAYKQFPEIICGNGYDAMCTSRFIRANGAVLLAIDHSKKAIPVISIERD